MHAGGAQLCPVLAGAACSTARRRRRTDLHAPLFGECSNVTLHVERLLVQAGPGHNVVCSGGASSWQHLALLLVAKHGGTEEAIRMSKLFLYQWHRATATSYASNPRTTAMPSSCIASNGSRRIMSDRTSLRSWCASPGCRSARSIAASAPRPAIRRWLYPDAACRGGEAKYSSPARSRWSVSGARSATRTRPRSAACSAPGMAPGDYRRNIGVAARATPRAPQRSNARPANGNEVGSGRTTRPRSATRSA